MLAALALLSLLGWQGSPSGFPVREWVELEKVVDGDTLSVRRAGKHTRLRLLCVDTEERFHPGELASGSKPRTVFGEQTALWAESLLDGTPRLGLCFPAGGEQHDAYGRLLCHVVLPDGRDYELELVRSGRSPYFNKYGNSQVAHAAFVSAQAEAQRRELGIWNPRTNQPKTPGVPAARRDYARLLPWWNARAEALAGFQKRLAAHDRGLVDAGDSQALERLVGQEVELFGEPQGQPREVRAGLEIGVTRQLCLFVPERARAALAPAKLAELGREYRQNFFYARGKLERGERGLELRLERPEQLRRAGPEPASAR
jgi:endonuclease YncB( thermonuclease family)